MKTFNTLNEYLQQAKENDVVIFGGKGLIDGIKNIGSKHDTYKVHKNTTIKKIVVKAYRGKKNLTLSHHSHNQQIALLTKKEFKNLPILW